MNSKKRKYVIQSFFIVSVLTVITFLFSCQKEQFENSASATIKFSKDTIMFDTVFSSIGSTTLRFKVYNPHDKSIRISKVFLGGAAKSNFRISVDGRSDFYVNNVEIPPKDSIYVFVEVTVDPNGASSPLMIKDSIMFETNGNFQNVKLIAWGQDIHLFNAEIIKSQTWLADKPYVIYSGILVDTLETLTIEAGVKIYFHRGAFMAVKGKLIVKGTKDNPVVFQGDRLEKEYSDIPGQWGALALISPEEHELKYAIVKNALVGLQIGEYNGNYRPKLKMEDCMFTTMSYAGIYAFNADIKASNCIISNCNSYLATLFKGGDYSFNQCTFSNDSNMWRSGNDPSVIISNYYTYYYNDSITGAVKSTKYSGSLDRADFGNTIIYGPRYNELAFLKNTDGGTFNYKFDHCLLEADPADNPKLYPDVDTSNNQYFIQCIWSKEPKFKSIAKLNYELDSLSPAIDKGSPVIGNLFPYDWNGVNRNSDAAPDIGAFEWKK
jgi:hypothetical protein